jgi:hypothetical protein
LALEEEAVLGREGPHTCRVCTCWLTRVVFSFKLVMESLARTNPLLTPLWRKIGDRWFNGCVQANPNSKKSSRTKRLFFQLDFALD